MDSEPPVQFRAGKKRKAFRRRASDESDPAQPDADQPSVAAALRARQTGRRRAGAGVAFSSDPRPDEPSSTALVLADDGVAPIKTIPDRFIHQTGLLAALDDRHMNEYIESRLSKRTDEEAPAKPAPSQPGETTKPEVHQSAGQGKIEEVNVPLEAEKRRRVKEMRRPRRGRRRNSDDVKRDQLVDAILHENRLDVYQLPAQATTAAAAADDRSADDRMADEFRQRYLDDLELKRQKRKPVLTRQQQQQQQQQEVLKGPKLGGSRNQRAAVRDALLKQERDKDKTRRF